ncbi:MULTISPECIES: flavodoxin family protein [Saccharothrix]|uniref:flavodoxin family protein n=1 Tax=Saccharothrix TaxID=2071 RepID=UPI000939CAD9|nr:flavodoxin family protein [Saccharothrix sp. CB00851]
MTTVSVVVHSRHGRGLALAGHIAAGAEEVDGTLVHLLPLSPEQVTNGRWADADTSARLAESDAIIFGSTTYMGSVSWVFKAFMEAAFDEWLVQGWKDKIAGGFTNSASQSGDKLLALQQLVVFAAQMNMLWVPVGDPPGNNWSGGSRDDVNRLGSWLGAMSQSNVDQGADLAGSHGDMVTARRYGARVARVAGRWAHGEPYVTERITEVELRDLNARVRADAPAR